MRSLLFILIALALVHVQCADVTYRVVGATSDFQNYIFSINNANTTDPPVSVTEGDRLIFRIEFSASIHPLGIYNDTTSTSLDITQQSNFSAVGCTKPDGAFAWYTTDSTNPSTNPCILSFTVPKNDPSTPVVYRCSVHPNMKGTITIAAAGTSSPTTTSAPTNASATPTPTNPPTGTPTPRSNAYTVLPGAAAFIVAVITALMA